MDDNLSLTELKQGPILDVPDHVVHGCRGKGIRHLLDLFRVAIMLKKVIRGDIVDHLGQFLDVVLDDTVVSVEAQDIVIGDNVGRTHVLEEDLLDRVRNGVLRI